jgi:tetratricopeptide (TPR) repeat protein
MKGLRKPQVLVLLAAVMVTVLLMMVPRMPAGARQASRPDPSAVKLAEAVALVNGQEPMRGIMMLREIVQEDPDNAEAHWQLGLFSVQSGQYDKALERFKRVLELSPDGYPDAWFYLGRTYATLDSTEQAIASLKRYKTLVQDTAILGGVDRFLNELENNEH